VVTVPTDAAAPAPLHVVLAASGAPKLAAQPRILIELAPGAKLTAVVHLVDAPGAAGWVNAVLEIAQAERSELALYSLQEHGGAQLHTSLVGAELGADALLTAAFLDAGGKLVRRDVDVKLAERGARADLFGIALA